MIIWLASYPRSGNTFLRMLLFHGYGIPTSSVHQDARLQKLGAADTIGHQPLPGSIAELARSPELYFVKTHDLPSDNYPALYVVRDGRDALVSYARYQLTFQGGKSRLRTRVKDFFGGDSFRGVLQSLIVGSPFGTWSQHVLAWTRRENSVTFLIRYEDLVQAPERWVAQALAALPVQPVAPTGFQSPDFAALNARWPEFFRKGQVGAWREEMPEDLQKLFWTHHGEAMRALSYT